MRFGTHCGHINIYKVIADMIPKRIWSVLFSIIVSVSATVHAADGEEAIEALQPVEPLVGSWAFSGMVTNESGERYGYFFQMQRQGSDFHAKTALIDGQTNKLIFFYESDEKIEKSTQLNWHVGHSFIRYNPINDSWIFGVKTDDEKGFNFKVDMLKQAEEKQTLVLRPGVELQALQTSRLNGHVQTSSDSKEQFVTGNNAWFGKVWFSKDQASAHDISTTFCRLNNDNGFYSANLKEADATSAAVAGWRDATGNKVKMSQFISMKSLDNNQCVLSLALPKINLKVLNTLTPDQTAPLSVAGFSNDQHKGFCFITNQSFAQVKESALTAISATA